MSDVSTFFFFFFFKPSFSFYRFGIIRMVLNTDNLSLFSIDNYFGLPHYTVENKTKTNLPLQQRDNLSDIFIFP